MASTRSRGAPLRNSEQLSAPFFGCVVPRCPPRAGPSSLPLAVDKRNKDAIRGVAAPHDSSATLVCEFATERALQALKKCQLESDHVILLMVGLFHINNCGHEWRPRSIPKAALRLCLGAGKFLPF